MYQISITLEDYIKEGNEIPSNIEKFETILPILMGYETTIKALFIQRNFFKDIGSETEFLFKHNLESLINSALSLYNAKLKIIQDNIENVLKRTVTETTKGTNETARTNETFLNPVNTNASKLTDKTATTATANYDEVKEKTFAYAKSNPELIQETMKLNTVINNILEYLDRAFIGEY